MRQGSADGKISPLCRIRAHTELDPDDLFIDYIIVTKRSSKPRR